MAPKFFKIIVHPQDHMLILPPEFMKRHGQNLTDHVSIKAPNGSVREVQLLRSNGETWLHEGWKEFKEDYSVGLGTLLTFTYDMNSHFDVLIYDVSGMEIAYPHDKHKMASARVSDDSVVFLKEISTNKKAKRARKTVETADHKGNSDFDEILEEDSAANEQRKRNRSNISSDAKQSSRKSVPFPNFRNEPVQASRVKFEECGEGIGNQFEERVQRSVPEETCIAYQRAKSCKFCNPFFISVMQPSYVSTHFYLNIPSTFARANLPEKKNTVKLCSLDGKTWTITCTKHGSRTKIYSGWKKFVQDNALKVGDACVFEVKKSHQLVWDVTIFRS